MAIRPVQAKVRRTLTIKGHEISGDQYYAGELIERPSVNAPSGQLRTLRIQAAVPKVVDDAVLVDVEWFDVTSHLENGDVEIDEQ